jgi:methyltransferase (TIGR00027 family)
MCGICCHVPKLPHTGAWAAAACRGACQNGPVTQGPDLASGGPSITARRVAAYRLGFTRVPAPYGDAVADETLAADVAAGQEPAAGRMRDYLEARTRFFDRVVVGAIGRGIRQIVVGAAGYDGRALRYARPGVRWFEVDHPATQRDKRDRLARLGFDVGQVQLVEADFTRDPIADRLTAAGLNPGQLSLFLLEGVAVYLEPAVLERVLTEFRQVARAGSRLTISVSTSGVQAEARSRFQATVAALGEPARSTLEAGQATEVLARTGWQVIAADDARSERLTSAGLLTATAAPTATTTKRPPKPQQAEQPQGPLSLSALLSHALVAFTIELDNEAEHRLPHRTTNHAGAGLADGTWLTSVAMFENCLRFVTDQPITVGELQTLARTGTNLDGMRRWGYITIDGTAKKIHHGRPGPGAVLRATARGLQARQIWLPLPAAIEQCWTERFGAGPIGQLRQAVLAVAGQLDPGLPDTLPILGQVLFSRGPDPALPPRPEPPDVATLPLSALLSRVLLAFALDYEASSEVSLAVGANLLRVLGEDGTRLRDLPVMTGISKEAVAWAMGVLIRARLAVEEPDPAASRGKVARLTSRGALARGLYLEFLGAVEDRWRDRFGRDTIGALRRPLEALGVGADSHPPPLFQGLEPYPDNWRASVRPPRTLPYYPMVLHRGGYPDGS